MSDAFVPTHTIPAGGLEVWELPDPSVASTAHLDPGVPVAVREQRGEWAHVVCDNGFSGWIGATTLQPVALATAPATSAAVLPGMPPAGFYASVYETAERGPAASPASLALAEGATVEAKPANITAVGVGAALTIIGCFLPWFSAGEEGITGYEIPVQFLLLKDSLSSGIGGDVGSIGPTIGLACLLAAIAGVVLSRSATTDKIRRLLGGLIVLLPTMAVGQVQLLISSADDSFGAASGAPSLLSTLGIGLAATMLGGLLLALSPPATKGSEPAVPPAVVHPEGGVA